MTYQEALAFIHGTYKFGSKLGLENIKTLLSFLGDPQKSLKFIHVAGTNGKGSTSAFIHSVLVEAGYRTGLYTSPFIETFNERMRVNHMLITEEELTRFTEQVKTQVDRMVAEGYQHPTEFEVVTAIAMLYYEAAACDLVVLEVGLGGRLDATNAIDTPLISVITPLDFDHTEYLGNTLHEIAFEKAGIIKQGGITVSYPQADEAMMVIKRRASEEGNTLIVSDFDQMKIDDIAFGTLHFTYKNSQYTSSLFAPYQAENASVALDVITCLTAHYGFAISHEQVREGIRKAQWIGRLEIVSKSPFIIIDGAHNMHGIKGLVKSVERLGKDYRIIGVIGILKDKDVDGMLKLITPYLDGVITTKPDNPRAMSAEELSKHLENVPIIASYERIADAVEKIYEIALHDTVPTLYLAFGSLYMIGEVRHVALLHQ
ncbi:MAG: bifunctional folylpolyglutamate synthase/dihydrofolate synthase [Firmicutes bacterium]|nr:bifunctional folylpolyglutamate synthase/dihydrofolate synthase [Bacillota bacterium]